MRSHRIALIPGDGIGTEVVPPACAVLDTVGQRHGFRLDYTEYDWGCARYAATGTMMPDDGLHQLSTADAILLGAVGYPGVPDHISLWGLLIPIRRTFDQYVNLRPITVFDGVPGPLRDATGTDIVIVRENVEGEYSTVGERTHTGTPHEQATQQSLFTRQGIERITRYALDTAATRRHHLTSATKSNGIIHTMPFWDDVVTHTVTTWNEQHATHPSASAPPQIQLHSEHIDALAAKLVLNPRDYDVIVASNLFGDILSDLAAALAGSIGIAPAGNINPSRRFPSMFEPVHGSAPDIAGRGVANPLGTVWAASMMLDHLGEHDAAAEIISAMTAVVADPSSRTADLAGTANTRQCALAVIAHLTAMGSRA
ncbi:D-malate dehydrogenase [decarboxylating] [Austwickia sp. TVS 96-490-7B]|uniref:tartrate dehydrogenase n=1 Tax=Austwickia sp. TVS 96-490-7B TaxID=2830843 RepID=UPI001C5739A8|nr:tartrate dehydrogenase [Austwickia sp. TVS 96-490-7B]MBW3085187.1 D-malate dehydrogenase [decarboxylating] [Austwickia sp. TVS 96-490-7B]